MLCDEKNGVPRVFPPQRDKQKVLLHQKKCLSPKGCPADLLKLFGSSKELSNYLAGVDEDEDDFEDEDVFEDGEDDEDDDDDDDEHNDKDVEHLKDGDLKDEHNDEDVEHLKDGDLKDPFPTAPYIPEYVWYKTQNAIMNPALRAQENAAVQQQVQEVTEAAVLKFRTLVDKDKRSAHDSFGNTNGLLQYAGRAAVQCMTQAPLPHPSVELPSSSSSSLSYSSLTHTQTRSSPSSSSLKRTRPSYSSSLTWPSASSSPYYFPPMAKKKRIPLLCWDKISGEWENIETRK